MTHTHSVSFFIIINKDMIKSVSLERADDNQAEEKLRKSLSVKTSTNIPFVLVS